MTDPVAVGTEWPGPILRTTLDALGDRDALSGIRLDRVTVGASVVLVELTAGTEGTAAAADPERIGLAHRPAGSSPVVPTDVRDSLTPLRSTETGPGGTGEDDRTADDPDPGARAVTVATLNALSAPLLAWQVGDPMALLDSAVDTVVTVGLFRPAFRKFDDVEVRVIERPAVEIGSVETPEGVTVRSFTPDGTAAAMDGADVVFVTGSTLVYGGTERYLDAAPSSATVVVVGATASSVPEPLFDRGVDVVAGARVTDPDRARAAVADGACGTDLHDRGVRKVYTARDAPATIDLQPGS